MPAARVTCCSCRATVAAPPRWTCCSATRPPWLSLWTTDDQVVQPPDSASLPGAVNVPLQSVCPGVSIGHGQLPTDPLVVGIVLLTLRSSALRPPRPADCGSLQALGGSGS
jgi:triacylglycerol lipase